MLILGTYLLLRRRASTRRLRSVGICAVCALSTACDSTTIVPEVVAEIEVRGVPTQVVSGNALDVAAVLRGFNGAPLPNQTVEFSSTTGSLDPASAVSDQSGMVRTRWLPGEAEGPQQLRLRAGNRTTEAATEVVPRSELTQGFDISLIGADSDTRVQAAATAAAARWSQVLVGDLPDQALNIAAGTCGISHPAITETVDDLALIVRIAPLDGPGGALASAGPCVLRPSNRLPALGAVVIDAADLEDLVTRETLDATLIHEIGHVLGLGSLWVGMGQTNGVGGADPVHIGIQTVAQFQAMGGSGVGVPLENFGATGTRDVHWRESILRAEVMTGWLTPGVLNPLSTITIGALADLGYDVDYAGADSFTTTSSPQRPQLFSPDLEIREHSLPRPIQLSH